jgi:hypothetical protein
MPFEARRALLVEGADALGDVVGVDDVEPALVVGEPSSSSRTARLTLSFQAAYVRVGQVASSPTKAAIWPSNDAAGQTRTRKPMRSASAASITRPVIS